MKITGTSVFRSRPDSLCDSHGQSLLVVFLFVRILSYSIKHVSARVLRPWAIRSRPFGKQGAVLSEPRGPKIGLPLSMHGYDMGIAFLRRLHVMIAYSQLVHASSQNMNFTCCITLRFT